MKKLMILAAVLVAAGIAGCSGEPQTYQRVGADDAITFQTSINDQAKTRASGTVWDAEDAIGVYMVQAGETSLASVIETNKKYVTAAGNGTFSNAPGYELYYPESGSVDFIAYYPYESTIGTNYLYSVALADQSAPADIDLMYARTNGAYSKSSAAPTLTFDHKLSKLVFNVTDTDGVSLDGITASIIGLYTGGTFNLSTAVFANIEGSNEIPFALRTVSATGASATIEAIVLPNPSATYEITLSVPGSEPMPYTISAANYESGKFYTYPVNVSERPTGTVVSIGAATINDWIEGDTGYDGPIELDRVTGDQPATPPTVTGITPSSLSFTAAGGTLTVAYVLNNPDNVSPAAVTVDGLSGTLSAVVTDATTITITAAANSGAAVSQTMNIRLNGEAAGTVSIAQAAGESSGAPTATFDFAGRWSTNTPLTGDLGIFTEGNVTLTFLQATHTNPPAGNGDLVRMYALKTNGGGNNLLINAGNKTITNIEFTYGSTVAADFKADSGTFASPYTTWTGSASSITFSAYTDGASNAQRHIAKIVVSFE